MQRPGYCHAARRQAVAHSPPTRCSACCRRARAAAARGPARAARAALHGDARVGARGARARHVRVLRYKDAPCGACKPVARPLGQAGPASAPYGSAAVPAAGQPAGRAQGRAVRRTESKSGLAARQRRARARGRCAWCWRASTSTTTCLAASCLRTRRRSRSSWASSCCAPGWRGCARGPRLAGGSRACGAWGCRPSPALVLPLGVCGVHARVTSAGNHACHQYEA
jgi:hypothetical protein